MSAVRTAAVPLMALILLCSLARGRRPLDARSAGDHGAAILQDDSSSVLIPLARLSAPSSVIPFARWGSRLKSVLEETIQEVVDECDFGPVALPTQHSRTTSVDLSSHPLPTAAPLRC
jgi:hypothetical protein